MLDQVSIDIIAAELFARKASLEKWLGENPHPYSVPEGTENDQRGTERERRIAEHKQAEDKLKEVVDALESIDNKTYGICPDCKDEIRDARLLSYPTAKRCILCQQKHGKPCYSNSKK